MDEQMALYRQLQGMLSEIDDINTLNMAIEQMTIVEDMHPELLSPSKDYLKYLPNDHGTSIKIGVIGYDSHYLAHAAELIYSNATIHWFTEVDTGVSDFTEYFDYILISPVCFEWLYNADSKAVGLLIEATSPNGSWVISVRAQLTYEKLVDYFNINGMLVERFSTDGFAVLHKPKRIDCNLSAVPKYKTVYVVCPQWIKSGGPELLHQLVYWINSFSGNAKICYYVTDENLCLCHPELAFYVVGHICRYEDIEDSSENAIVIPEGWPSLAMDKRKLIQYFWWLSVDNYFISVGGEERACSVLSTIDSYSTFHLFQSEYAKSFLLMNQIPAEKLIHLGDYINQSYLDNYKNAIDTKKEDIILYNPKKGKEFVDELRNRAPDLQWKAIENMTTEEVGNLMRKSKVYIDFGNHPGKDRIPREAAMSGCVVITGKKGSAAFDEDVPIPPEYKIDESVGDEVYAKAVTAIRDSLLNYYFVINKFTNYRERILVEKEEFLGDIKKVFFE